jgi:hypothetical protein
MATLLAPLGGRLIGGFVPDAEIASWCARVKTGCVWCSLFPELVASPAFEGIC